LSEITEDDARTLDGVVTDLECSSTYLDAVEDAGLDVDNVDVHRALLVGLMYGTRDALDEFGPNVLGIVLGLYDPVAVVKDLAAVRAAIEEDLEVFLA
jgi:hypothetical protein